MPVDFVAAQGHRGGGRVRPPPLRRRCLPSRACAARWWRSRRLRLDGDETRDAMYELIDETQRIHFEEHHELDFAFEIPGLSRFRANFFEQRRGPAAVFRVIASEMPSLEDLRSPAVLRELRQQGARAGARDRTDGKREVDDPRGHDRLHQPELPGAHHHRSRTPSSSCTSGSAASSTSARSGSTRRASPLRSEARSGRIRTSCSWASCAIWRPPRSRSRPRRPGTSCSARSTPIRPARPMDRLIDIFPADRQAQVRTMLSESLEGVIAQSLIPTADGKGRVAAYEILIGVPALRNLIREAKTAQIPSVMQVGAAYGMITLDQSLKELVTSGKITAAAAARTLDQPQALREQRGRRRKRSGSGRKRRRARPARRHVHVRGLTAGERGRSSGPDETGIVGWHLAISGTLRRGKSLPFPGHTSSSRPRDPGTPRRIPPVSPRSASARPCRPSTAPRSTPSSRSSPPARTGASTVPSRSASVLASRPRKTSPPPRSSVRRAPRWPRSISVRTTLETQADGFRVPVYVLFTDSSGRVVESRDESLTFAIEDGSYACTDLTATNVVSWTDHEVRDAAKKAGAEWELERVERHLRSGRATATTGRLLGLEREVARGRVLPRAVPSIRSASGTARVPSQRESHRASPERRFDPHRHRLTAGLPPGPWTCASSCSTSTGRCFVTASRPSIAFARALRETYQTTGPIENSASRA